jgi:DNA-binding HxlR family transcriptional regulator
MKRHSHYCPIARSLDLLGDRWSILILRELLLADRRFSELRANLPGISPTLLTERLQALAAHDLLTTRTVALPAPHTVYSVTDKGREVGPILRAMSRFGMSLLPSPRRVAKIRPATAAHSAVAAYYDGDAAAGIDEWYRLVLDGETFDLASARGGRPAASRAEPDLVLTGPARALIAARRGETTLGETIASGVIATHGNKRALRNFQRVFRLA